MLQAHSLLWHYLWVAPSLLLLVLACRLWQRSLQRRYAFFLAFALASAVEQLTLYACDLMPSVTAATWWKVFWVGLFVEGILKFALVGEIFAQAFNAYASIAKLGTRLIRGIGITLVLAAAIAAGFAPKDSLFGIVSGAHLLQQTIYLIECGLLLFIFVFSSYFSIHLSRPVFGIALGLAVSGCVHLATWAVAANSGLPPERRIILDFVNMATYHVCVLIWFYYLLVPGRVAIKSIVSVPEHSLEVWNQELERLLHQ
jgi:hypothetical protein